MSLVYNDNPKVRVKVTQISEVVNLQFTADGTDEIVAEYTLSVSKLMAVLDYSED